MILLEEHEAYTILSEEGVTQGDPLSMILYGLALVALGRQLQKEVKDIILSFYADDAMEMGSAAAIYRVFSRLQELGPARGYYPEPTKSVLVCTETKRAAVQRVLGEFKFKYKDGARYLGGFIGTDDARDEWVKEQVDDWVYGV